jgi:hypothetical protein
MGNVEGFAILGMLLCVLGLILLGAFQFGEGIGRLEVEYKVIESQEYVDALRECHAAQQKLEQAK